MKGVDNKVFEKSDNISQGRPEDFEMKEPPPGDTTVIFENPKNQKTHEPNLIVKWNLKFREWLGSQLFGKNKTSQIFWILLINGAAAGFLIASVVKYYENVPSTIDWCDGIGFFWILFILTYIGVLNYLRKKFLGKCFSCCLKPLKSCSASLGANRYFRAVCYLTPVLLLIGYVIISPGKSGRRMFSALGIIVFVVLGYLFSRHPVHVKWRPVICGMALQFAFGLLTIRLETGKNVLDCLGKKVTRFLHYTEEGAGFVFGSLAKPESDISPIFAFSVGMSVLVVVLYTTVLPVIYFLSFFINILSYYGALQWFIMKLSSIVRLGMGTTVCESVNAAASIFLGMTEAPLLIQSYLKDLTKSELCAILCAGWSTVAGVVMAAYIQFGVKASHLIAASVMSAPASLSYSKLIYPETEESKTTIDNIVLHKMKAANVLDAASKGALSGISIIGSIIANIIAFLAFLAFIDGTLGWIGGVIGLPELSFQFLMSKIFYPISFLMGVDEDSLEDVAYLVGIKTVANEFQAYQKLGELIKANKLSERSEIIATYALCGFSNFGSIGITVGTLSAMEPSKSSAVTEVAIPAFIAANIVCFLTACVAGCMID